MEKWPRATKSWHLTISGRVQGVGYRDWAVRAACSFRIDGWVRNRSNGMVEMVAQGVDADVSRFIEACRSGPTLARVDDILVRELEGEPISFGEGFYTRDTV